MTRGEKWALAVVGLFALAVAHPICNLFFRCGCGWLGPAHCNIHQAMGPHCPWCVGGGSRFFLVAAAWALGIWAGAGAARRFFGGSVLVTFSGGLFGFAGAALASGAATVALTGYPHFLFF